METLHKYKYLNNIMHKISKIKWKLKNPEQPRELNFQADELKKKQKTQQNKKSPSFLFSYSFYVYYSGTTVKTVERHIIKRLRIERLDNPTDLRNLRA